MKIMLRPIEIANNIASEEDLLDSSMLEGIYEIRKLRAGILLDGFEVEVDEPNSHGYVYLKDHKIWIRKGEYSIIE